MSARAWLLNFDADEELAAAGGYVPSSRVVGRFTELARRAGALVPEGDVVLPEGRSPASFAGGGFTGRAFCPTPRAVAAWTRAGVRVPDTPPLAVLRRVNHRRFAAELGQTLPGARFARTAIEVADALGGPSPTGAWLLKLPFGFAGRGRRKVERALDEADRAWVDTAMRAGEGLQVEPWVERCGDFALHGFARRDGEPVLGEPTAQECDAGGAWRGTCRALAGELSAAEAPALLEAATRAARALRAAGYFGPFGVDAFRWADATGAARFNPCCEINARYSMGWATGMGDRRPDLELG